MPGREVETMKPAYLCVNTLDDRREIHRLLEHLHPYKRLRFLNWCCASAVVPNSATRPGILPAMRQRAELARIDGEMDRRLATEAYMDCIGLAAQYGMDLGEVVKTLEQFAKGHELPPPLKAAQRKQPNHGKLDILTNTMGKLM